MSEQPSNSPISSVLGITSTMSLSAMVLVLVLTAWHWEGIVWVGTRYGLFVVVPLVLLIGLWTKSAGKTAGALLLSVLCGAPLYLWALPETRVAVLEIAGSAIPGSSIVRAIEDSDGDVANAACVALVSRGYDSVRTQLPELMKRPEVVSSCLLRDVEGTDASALLRKQIAQEWEDRILKANTPNACGLLPHLQTLSQVQSADAAARLLRIATTAHHDAVKLCAMEAFSTTYPSPLKQLQALGNPSQIDPLVAESLFRGLTNMTYGTKTTGVFKEITDTPLMRQWGLSLGCRVIVESKNASETAGMLNTAVSLQGCGMAEGDQALSVWSGACIDALEGNQEGLVTTSAVCDRIQKYAFQTATTMASTIVHGAITRLTQQELERQIAIGDRQEKWMDRLAQFTGSEQSEDALSDLPPAMAQDVRRQLGAIKRSQTSEMYDLIAGSPMRSGMNKGMVEVYLKGGNGGLDPKVRKAIEESGGNVDEIFSKENMANMNLIAKDKHLDQSAVNVDGLDAGVENDAGGITVEEFLGEQRDDK